MIDIQSPMAEIMRGKKRKKKERKKKPQDENIMACPIPWGGHKKVIGEGRHTPGLEMGAHLHFPGLKPISS